MKLFNEYIKHIVIGILSLLILVTTLFIGQSPKMPERTVGLGYPINFVILDFTSNQSTNLAGAPDTYLATLKFNITSSWEEYAKVQWINALISYSLLFILFEGIHILIFKLVKIR